MILSRGLGQIKIKDHLSPAEAEVGAEPGNSVHKSKKTPIEWFYHQKVVELKPQLPKKKHADALKNPNNVNITKKETPFEWSDCQKVLELEYLSSEKSMIQPSEGPKKWLNREKVLELRNPLPNKTISCKRKVLKKRQNGLISDQILHNNTVRRSKKYKIPILI